VLPPSDPPRRGSKSACADRVALRLAHTSPLYAMRQARCAGGRPPLPLRSLSRSGSGRRGRRLSPPGG
jgi:hypothetical protein